MKKYPTTDELAKAFPYTYAAWKDMWARCTDPKHPNYPEEGGRGITVAKQWENFAVFLNDMGPCPSDL